MSEEIAIIKDINIGLRDVGTPVIWFEVQALHGSSLQVIDSNQILDFIKEAKCNKLSDLNGKPCIIRSEGNTMKFMEVME